MSPEKKSLPTIKSAVFDAIHRAKGKITYEDISSEVKGRFPESKWQRSHWAWYKHHIAKGRFSGEFSKAEKENLASVDRSVESNQAEIKRVGDAVLRHVRFVLDCAAKDDVDLRFKLNRWVFARLQLDERKAKRPIKEELWEIGDRSCHKCHKAFPSLKGVELHRLDPNTGYSLENCVLLHKSCHQKISKDERARGSGQKG